MRCCARARSRPDASRHPSPRSPARSRSSSSSGAYPHARRRCAGRVVAYARRGRHHVSSRKGCPHDRRKRERECRARGVVSTWPGSDPRHRPRRGTLSGARSRCSRDERHASGDVPHGRGVTKASPRAETAGHLGLGEPRSGRARTSAAAVASRRSRSAVGQQVTAGAAESFRRASRRRIFDNSLANAQNSLASALSNVQRQNQSYADAQRSLDNARKSADRRRRERPGGARERPSRITRRRGSNYLNLHGRRGDRYRGAPGQPRHASSRRRSTPSWSLMGRDRRRRRYRRTLAGAALNALIGTSTVPLQNASCAPPPLAGPRRLPEGIMERDRRCRLRMTSELRRRRRRATRLASPAATSSAQTSYAIATSRLTQCARHDPVGARVDPERRDDQRAGRPQYARPRGSSTTPSTSGATDLATLYTRSSAASSSGSPRSS